MQPPVVFGAILTLTTTPIAWTFMAFDANDRTGDYWPDDLFDDGIDVSVAGKYTGRFAGRTTTITASGIYTTKDGANLGELLLPPDLQTGDKDGSWNISVQVAHFLRENPARPDSGWGVFLKTGAGDGNPNPYQGLISGGIGGRGFFRARPADAFGVGYFYCNFSDELQSALNPLLAFRDEQGIEAFYDADVTRWLSLSFHLQYVSPALADIDDAVTGGLRIKIRL